MQKLCRMLKPIKNKKEHSNYLVRAYELMQMDIEPNSLESDKLEVLSILIETYEKEHFPIEPPNPIDAILFRIDQLGMKKSELIHLLKTLGVAPHKKLGQNFLHDQNILKQISQWCRDGQENLIVEIGPGIGNLTDLIISDKTDIITIEYDKKLAHFLEEKYRAGTCDRQWRSAWQNVCRICEPHRNTLIRRLALSLFWDQHQ